MTNETNLHTAILAAIAAGKEIMAIYSTDFDVEEKSDNSPLTIADKNANELTFKFFMNKPIFCINGTVVSSNINEIEDFSSGSCKELIS